MRSSSGSRRSRLVAVAGAALAAAAVAGALVLAPGGGDDGGSPGGAAERPPRALTILQDDALLLHGPEAQVARTLDELRALGVDWVRVTAGWSVVAPEPAAARRPRFDASDPDAYPPGGWAALDRVARLARERGLRLLVDIAFYAPRWGVGRPSTPPRRQRTEIDPAAYADFAEAVARRFPDAVAFTIWNEPNFKSFWLPQWERERGRWVPASPHAYRELLTAAVPRLREAAPDALVLIGGTASVGSSDPDDPEDGVPPLRFVRELACVDERLEPLERAECEGFEPLPGDGFAHHPISFDLPPWVRDPAPDNVRMGDLARLTRLLRALHERGRTEGRLPVYSTEYGYQTNPPDPTQHTSPAEQARWLPEADRIATSEPGVVAHSQFLLRDLGTRPGTTDDARWRDSQMGLRFADGRPKPAERAFALSLAARRTAPGRVSFWARLRAAREPVEVRIAVHARGGWHPLATRRTDDRGIVEAELAADPSGAYRLEARSNGGWVTGLPVRPR
jgi:hypothetical protein